MDFESKRARPTLGHRRQFELRQVGAGASVPDWQLHAGREPGRRSLQERGVHTRSEQHAADSRRGQCAGDAVQLLGGRGDFRVQRRRSGIVRDRQGVLPEAALVPIESGAGAADSGGHPGHRIVRRPASNRGVHRKAPGRGDAARLHLLRDVRNLRTQCR